MITSNRNQSCDIKKKITFNRNQYFLETITHPWFKRCEELEGAIISNTAKNIPLNQKRKHGQPYKAKNGLSRYFLRGHLTRK